MLRSVMGDEGLEAAAARRVAVLEARRYLCGGVELGFLFPDMLSRRPWAETWARNPVNDLRINGPMHKAIDPGLWSTRTLDSAQYSAFFMGPSSCFVGRLHESVCVGVAAAVQMNL